MFSESCKYAIKAAIYLASADKSAGLLSGKDIAKAINAPVYFLAGLLQELSKKKIINSMRGSTGGFFMTEEQKNKPIIDIVYLIDGNKLFNECVLGLPDCNSDKPCPMHFQYQAIKKNITAMLQNSTIQDFNNLVVSREAFLVNQV